MSASSSKALSLLTRDRGIVLTLTISGLIGFLMGCFVLPDWQVAVETAQVVAGIVQYPHDNPFYMYHVKLWTILHQFLAVLLKAGISEHTASLLVSGLLGMVSFQAMATIILALSGDVAIALAGALLIFLARPNEFGVVYPVWFMGSEHTYGVLGFSYMLLVVGLLGGGWRRSGALLLGLAPAVHPSLGFWLGIIVGGCCLLDIRHFRENWKPWLKFFFIGGAISTVSLIFQMTVTYDVAKTPLVDTARYFHSFVSFWDMHRAPVDSSHPGVTFNWWLLVYGIVWLIFFTKELPSHALFIVRAIVIASTLGLGAMAVSWISPEKLPRTLVMLMPARILNFSIMISLPFLIGAVGAQRRKIWGQFLLIILLLAITFGGAVQEGTLMFFSSHIWQLLVSKGAEPKVLTKLMLHPWKSMAAISIALIIGMAIERFRPKKQTPERSKHPKHASAAPGGGEPGMSPGVIWLQRVSWILFAAIFVLTFMLASMFKEHRKRAFNDWTNDPVFAEAAKGEGLLLTGGDLHLVQLKTRRPVLLDGGGLDGIAYIPQAAPQMEKIMKEVYKIDWFNPPEEARGQGSIPRWTGKAIWESFPEEHWIELSRLYGFRDVLTYGDWSLSIPKVIGNDDYILYRVPKSP